MSTPAPVDALIMQVQTQAESEFAAPFIAEIEKLIGSLRDIQPNAAPQPTRAKSTQHYPLSKVASHCSSAEMKRERDVAIVRGALTENWQETNWIYQKARIRHKCCQLPQTASRPQGSRSCRIGSRLLASALV
jgi:hypothetical protein